MTFGRKIISSNRQLNCFIRNEITSAEPPTDYIPRRTNMILGIETLIDY